MRRGDLHRQSWTQAALGFGMGVSLGVFIIWTVVVFATAVGAAQ